MIIDIVILIDNYIIHILFKKKYKMWLYNKYFKKVIKYINK